MIEFIAAFILILLTVLYFLTRNKKVKGEKDDKKSNKNKSKTNTPSSSSSTNTSKTTASNLKTAPSAPEVEKKESLIVIDKTKIVEAKSMIINSFREGKDLRNPFSSIDGKTILFHDDKHIYLSFLNNFTDKTPKFLSKTVEQDVITDASFSEDKR
jgi:hypothetical protein